MLKFLDDLRTSLWFVPSLMTIAAAVLSVVIMRCDEVLAAHHAQYDWLRSFTYSGNPEGARSILAAIAGSMITVAGTVFSINIVALSLASSQFGPRLLRNFLRDRLNQAVLGTFVATFLYCILAMRRVVGSTSDVHAFVPILSVTISIGLGVASLGVLIYFIHHIAQSIQAEQILSAVYQEVEEQLDELFPRDLDAHSPCKARSSWITASAVTEEAERRFKKEAKQVVSEHSGYIQAIDIAGLFEIAKERGLIIRVTLRAGEFVLPGAVVAEVISHGDPTPERFTEAVHNCFALGSHRTPQQNVQFSVDQIVEVAVRALSPGINDPFTAIAAIDRLGAIFGQLAKRLVPPPYIGNDKGELCLVVPAADYRHLVERAFNQIRQNARNVPAVIIYLTQMLERIGTLETDPDRRSALVHHLDAISEQSKSLTTPCDRAALEEQIGLARRALSSA